MPYANLGPENVLSFSVKTKPNSYAGLVAVDEEIAKLGKDNELSTEKVYHELFKKYMKKESNYIDSDLIEGFQNSEAFILTNAKNERKLYAVNRDPVTIKNDDNTDKYSTIRTDIGPAHSFKFKTKPPLAGPYAFSRIPKPRWENPRIYLKKFVKDSWFSEEIASTGYDGRTTITRKTPPEHPQNYKISGFSVDPIFGLGVNSQLSQIHVSRNFYITTRLPRALKEGEIISVPITAINNFNSSIKVEIHFQKNDEQFAIVNEKDGTDLPKSGGFSSEKKEITVPAKGQTTVAFIIRPKKIGQIKIRANGISNIAVDEIEKFIRIDHIGAPRTVTKKYFINLQRNPEFNSNVSIPVPTFNVIPQSIRVDAAGRRNLIEMTLDKLKASAQMFRQTNGEDNALSIIANCLLLQNTPLQSTTEERRVIQDELETRYQSQLSFKRADGSFSMFGKIDKTGNVWLTALSAKALALSANFIDVDARSIEKAFEFLANVQSKDGSFSEFGDVYHAEVEEKHALTALVLTSFLSSTTYEKKNRNSINKAVDYLVRNINEINDAYPLAISAYSLQVAKHIARDAFFTKLDGKASVMNDSKHWENGTPEQKNSWYIESNGLNIETTAYALLTLAEGNLYFDAVPIVKWLVEHENQYLGATKVSRSDIVTLEALLRTLPRISNVPSNINMDVKYDEVTTNLMENRNSKYSIPASIKGVEINANGQGYGIVEIESTFNTNVTVGWPRFTLDPQVNRQSTKNFLHLTICTSFVPDNYSTSSNGAIMEVSFPSGFVFDRDTIPFLKSTEKIKVRYCVSHFDLLMLNRNFLLFQQ